MLPTDITVSRIDVGDAELEYWDRGPDDRVDAILLAHAGVIGDWFRPVFDDPALDGFRVIRVHRAGYGLSSRPDAPLSLADHARQCCRLLTEIGVRDATWVGHSSSACIGLQAALDVPDLITRLVLLEPAPKPAGPSRAQFVRDVIGPAMAAVGAGDFAQAADIFLRGVDGPTYRDTITTRLGADALHGLVHDATYFFTDEFRAAVEWDIDEATATRITIPTTVAVGGDSTAAAPVHRETADLLAAMLPDARLVTLPGVGHGMPLQDPAAVARLIAEAVGDG